MKLLLEELLSARVFYGDKKFVSSVIRKTVGQRYPNDGGGIIQISGLKMDKRMSEHDERMARLSVFAGPPHGTEARKAWEKWIRSLPRNTKLDRAIRKKFKEATTIIKAQYDSGAGFPIDSLIREFLLEYNGRNFEHGLRLMPSSFNIMESFHRYIPDIAIFKLYPEIDHLFSSIEFLDYVTSPDAHTDIREVLHCLEDSVIYSYNVINGPEDITFSIAGGTKYGIGGAALIRHGNEISALLLAGQKTDLSERTREIREAITDHVFPGKESIKPAEDRTREAVPLLGNREFWQTLVLIRFDLETITFDVRYILTDWGNSFDVQTDDTSIFRSEVPPHDFLPEYEQLMKKQLSEIGRYETLFELCKTALYLPLFFEEHAEDIRIENHPTKFLEQVKGKGGRKRKVKFLRAADRITHRPVSVLQLPDRQHPIRTLHKAPPIKIEVSGFWKNIAADQIGTDKHGSPIHGRTWVEKTLTWTEGLNEPGSILAERHTATPTIASQTSHLDRGFIYVMRSAAHAKDIFKIGSTRRTPDSRSDELSYTTGSPDKFLVVQEWEVSDCVKAELLIHQALEQYRINPGREFFKASYKVINKVIEEVVNQFKPESE